MTTKYQQFVKDNQRRIKEEFPELSNTERFVKLADEWKKHKATLEEPARTANAAANAANSANAANAANAANSKYATEFYIARLVLTHAMLHI